MSNVLDSVRYNPLSEYYKADLCELTKDQRETLLRDRRERTACNRHIFRQVATRAKRRRQVIELEIGKNYSGFKLPGVENSDRGIRGKVTGFSLAARGRMLKDQASLERYPRIWQDFTFADDVMVGKSISERAVFSSMVMENWQRYAKRKYPGIWGTWKREWQDRKSGIQVGEWCPHFHVLWDWDALSRENWEMICQDLAIKWVLLTGTTDQRAIPVAINGESYRWLNDTHMAQVYVSKYVAKVQMMETGGSLGRFWGRIGKPPMAEKVNKPLSFTEMVWLARLLPNMTRRLRYQAPLEVRKRNKSLEKRLAKTSGWLMVRSESMQRLLTWISEQEQKEVPSRKTCPF